MPVRACERTSADTFCDTGARAVREEEARGGVPRHGPVGRVAGVGATVAA